jgi:hypothetical protein
MSQEAKERCELYLQNHSQAGLNNKNKQKISILGVRPKIRRAPEPSDVIWSNI